MDRTRHAEKDEQRYGNQRRDRQRQGPVRGPEPVPGADAGHRQKGLCPGNPGPGGGHPLLHGVEGRDREGPHRNGQDLCLRHPYGRARRSPGDPGHRPGAGPHPGAGHPDPGRAAGPVRVQGGGAHRVSLRRAAHRQTDPPAEKGPPDRGGHPRAPDGPCEAAHRPAGQGGDGGAGRGRPHAGHGLCPGCDPHPGPDAQTEEPGHVLRHHFPGSDGYLLGVPAGPGRDHGAR